MGRREHAAQLEETEQRLLAEQASVWEEAAAYSTELAELEVLHMRESAQHQASVADTERQQQAREGLERWWAMSARLSQEALASRAATAEESTAEAQEQGRLAAQKLAEAQEALRGEMSELVAAHTTAMASQRQQHEEAQASAEEAAQAQASTAKEEMTRRVESVERDAQAQVEAVQKAHEEKLRTHERQRKEAAERQELERIAQDKVRSELEEATEALRERAAESQSYQEELEQWETLGARAAQSEEQHTATAGALREEAAAARQELAEQRRLYSEEISAASAAEQQRHAASEEEHARLSAELETLRQPPPAVTSGPLDFSSTPTTMLDSVDGEDNEEEEDQQEPEESAPPPAETISSEAQTAATSNPAEMQALSDEFAKLVSDVAETQALVQLKIKTHEDHAREEQQLRDSEAAAIRQHVQKGAREAIESHADVLLEHLESAEQDWYKERQLLMSIDVTASLDEPGELGLRWAYDARLGGVVVQAVEPHSQAQRSPRLCVGLVLKSVGGVHVSGLSYAETLKQLATEDRPLELRLTPAALPVPPRQVPPLVASLQEEGPLGIGFKFDKISRHVFVESVKPSSQASRQPRIQPGKLHDIYLPSGLHFRHLGCILLK